MLEAYGLYCYRRLIGILGRIYADPRRLAICAVLLIFSLSISFREFQKEQDGRPVSGKIFANTLWLSFGLGFPVAVAVFGAGLFARVARMRRLGKKLLALSRFIFFPYKYHLVVRHHVPADAAMTLWGFVAGIWGAALETVIGTFYCLSLIGIPVGLIHLRLAIPIWTPHRFHVFTDVELDEFLDSRRRTSG